MDGTGTDTCQIDAISGEVIDKSTEAADDAGSKAADAADDAGSKAADAADDVENEAGSTAAAGKSSTTGNA